MGKQTDRSVQNFVSFVVHGRTRQSNSLNLKIPFCTAFTLILIGLQNDGTFLVILLLEAASLVLMSLKAF